MVKNEVKLLKEINFRRISLFQNELLFVYEEENSSEKVLSTD